MSGPFVEISFTKMHGTGNDFVLIDCRSFDISGSFNISILARMLCERRFGIGADQLLLLYSSKTADFKMSIFNSDGSEVEMCGNGVRCLAKYIWDRELSDSDVLRIETLAGVIMPERAAGLVRVDMGEPVFEPSKIPVDSTSLKSTITRIIDYPLQVKDREFKITCVSMGNPHAVIFLKEDLSDFPVSLYGPEIEKHPFFPNRTNVEFVNINSSSELTMRVWERGAGETMACGTGASAAAVASMLKGLMERRSTVNLLGGQLFIEWLGNNRVYMTGAAVEVYEGRIKLITDQDERRKHHRRFYNTDLRYYREGEPETKSYSSTSIDISDSGIGIITDHELEPGQVIIFKNKENPTVHRIAIVQWSMKSGGKYRAGLLFI